MIILLKYFNYLSEEFRRLLMKESALSSAQSHSDRDEYF